MRKIRVVSLIGTIISIISIFTITDANSNGRIQIRGTVTRLSRVDDVRRKNVLGYASVEGAKEADTEYDKAQVKITDQTKIFMIAGGERNPSSFSDLRQGQKVEVSFTGAVMESYPVQATAAEIVILER